MIFYIKGGHCCQEIVDAKKMIYLKKKKSKKRRRHEGLTCICMKIEIKLENRGECCFQT